MSKLSQFGIQDCLRLQGRQLLLVGVILPTQHSGALAATAAAKTTHRHVNLSWLVTRKKAGLLQPVASNTRTTPATPALVQMKRE
jgi:hypothetical protein